jgi:hypothetical protein
MTPTEIRSLLLGFVRNFQIDPHDAGEIWGEIPETGLDAETLGDRLDGTGYPELATIAYAQKETT